MRTVLVTGAAGFIGGRVARHLADAGWVVRAGYRPGGRRPAGHDGGVPGALEPVAADVTDPRGLAAALAGCDAVAHCAVGDAAVTIDGTRAVLDAAGQAGVGRWVHLSSVAVFGAASGAVTDAVPLVAAGRDSYGAMKAAAEQACRERVAAGAAPPDGVILRPTIVTGPGSDLWTLKMGRRLASGRWGTFGAAADGLCNPIHVDDLAAAVGAALARDPAPQSDGSPPPAHIVTGPETLTWNDYFRRLNGAMGRPPLPVIGPGALKARIAAGLPAKALSRLLPALGAPLRPWLDAVPAMGELTLFALRATYDGGGAEAALRWRPRHGVDATLAEAADWLLDRGIGGRCSGGGR